MPPRSTEARAPHRSPENFPSHLPYPAHLGQPRAHTLSDPVAQFLFAHCTHPFATRRRSASGSKIRVIGRYDVGQLVVVAAVEDQGDRVPNPVGGFLRT